MDVADAWAGAEDDEGSCHVCEGVDSEACVLGDVDVQLLRFCGVQSMLRCDSS